MDLAGNPFGCGLDDGQGVKAGYWANARHSIYRRRIYALDVEQRNKGLEIALPIKKGNIVWIGANVAILPALT